MNPPWLAPYRVADLSRSLQAAGIVLPAGEPLPRFEKTWFEGLIGALYRINYDFIVIDGPALTVSPLVPQLVGIAEGVLLAVKSGATTARALRRALRETGRDALRLAHEAATALHLDEGDLGLVGDVRLRLLHAREG